MKQFLIGALFLFFLGVNAQTTTDNIDRDVWFPFVESFNSYDAEAFIGIHTDDIIRINRDGQAILEGSAYAESIRNTCINGLESGSTRTIEFTFIERIHKNDIAFEEGYYRVKGTYGGEEYTSFGKFQVVLKKIDGIWKIAIDSDSSEGNTIVERDFMSGAPLRR